MCGIGGYFLKPGGTAPAGFLDRLEEGLRHRGPDGSGQAKAGSAGFCHTRLAIIDLEGGGQPFRHNTEAGPALAIANGEVYNHHQLRATLPADMLDSASDCAVLLPLWLEHGPGFVEQLRGMYAAALYDAGHDRGCLIRDPFGIKPLYLLEDERGVFFASELTALRRALGYDAPPSRQAAASILDRQFILGGATPFAAIRKLAPGEAVTIEAGRITASRIDDPLSQPIGGPREEDLDGLLRSTVEAHQLSDVPFGMFLSGGVDSSILLALMAQLRLAGQVPDHTPELLAYTARFDRASVADETDHARQLADKVGASFIDVGYGEADFLREAGMAVAATDDPVADYAILPTWHLARRASADVKVILTGEGGDEFFAGYGRYRAGLRPLGAKMPNRPGPALNAALLHDDLAAGLRAQLAVRPRPSFGQRLMARDEALRALQRHDIAEWLPDNLLIKADRCLMHHGIEGRTPFIDRHLSAHGFHLPADRKIRGRHGKAALKFWLEQHLPEAAPFTPKRGFTVPVGEWIARHARHLAPLAASVEGVEAVVDARALPGLFEAASGRHGLLAWRVLYYALWWQIHCVGINPDQPIDAILSAQP